MKPLGLRLTFKDLLQRELYRTNPLPPTDILDVLAFAFPLRVLHTRHEEDAFWQVHEAQARVRGEDDIGDVFLRIDCVTVDVAEGAFHRPMVPQKLRHRKISSGLYVGILRGLIGFDFKGRRPDANVVHLLKGVGFYTV